MLPVLRIEERVTRSGKSAWVLNAAAVRIPERVRLDQGRRGGILRGVVNDERGAHVIGASAADLFLDSRSHSPLRRSLELGARARTPPCVE